MAKTTKKLDAPDASKLKVGDTIPCALLMKGMTSEPVVLVVTNTLNDEDGHSVDFDLTFFGQVIGKARGWVEKGGLSWDEDITPDYNIPLLDTGEKIVSDAEYFSSMHADAEAYDGMIVMTDADVIGSIEAEQSKSQHDFKTTKKFIPWENPKGVLVNQQGQTRAEFEAREKELAHEEDAWKPEGPDHYVQYCQEFKPIPDALNADGEPVNKALQNKYEYATYMMEIRNRFVPVGAGKGFSGTGYRKNKEGQSRKQFIEAELQVEKALRDIGADKKSYTLSTPGGFISDPQMKRVDDADAARWAKKARFKQRQKAKEGTS